MQLDLVRSGRPVSGLDKREVFGTESLLQFTHLLEQRLGFLAIFLPINLLTEMGDLTVGLGLRLIATDDADNFLCVRLQFGGVRLLSLRIQGHGGDY